MKLIINTSWIVRIMACWALILAILNLANILLLTSAAEFYTNQYDNQMQVWFIFVFDIIFSAGFLLSAYGLWTYKSWGRIVFLWLISSWAGLNIVGLLFSTEQYNTGQLGVNISRFLITLLIPLWYLHRPHVKAFFEDYRLEEQKLLGD